RVPSWTRCVSRWIGTHSIATYLTAQCSARPRDLHSFPTRRSSDLVAPQHGPGGAADATRARADGGGKLGFNHERRRSHHRRADRDRKSTRLNSSHLGISYAVFCLKKKKSANQSTVLPHTKLPLS